MMARGRPRDRAGGDLTFPNTTPRIATTALRVTRQPNVFLM